MRSPACVEQCQRRVPTSRRGSRADGVSVIAGDAIGSRQSDGVDGLRPQAVERPGKLFDPGEQAVIGDESQGGDDDSRGKRGQRGGQKRNPTRPTTPRVCGAAECSSCEFESDESNADGTLPAHALRQ